MVRSVTAEGLLDFPTFQNLLHVARRSSSIGLLVCKFLTYRNVVGMNIQILRDSKISEQWGVES